MNPFSPLLLERLPIVAILRGFSPGEVQQIVAIALRSGLLNLEITMNSPGAQDQIRTACELSAGRMNIGAGTVTTLTLLERALEAGASFVVTPVLNRSVMEACRERGVPVFPGAFSPTEIWEAWELGATMVKVFPSDNLGPGFIKALKGPFPHVKLMPTGGVDVGNLQLFRKAGADGFGIGSPLFPKEQISRRAWDEIESRCRGFVQAYREGKPG